MMTQNTEKNRTQIQMFCIDDLVPQDHLLKVNDYYDDYVEEFDCDNSLLSKITKAMEYIENL